MLYKRLIINGTEYKLAVDQSGSGVPTVHTQGAVGVLYMDTDNGSLYKCTSVADGKYTWEPLETGGGSGKDGGYYTPEVTQPDSKTMEIAFSPSKAGMPTVEPVQVKLPVPDSTQNSNQGGMSETESALLISILRKSFYASNQAANIDALEEALASGESGDTHTHSYTSAVTEEATCTTAGARTHTCSCGHSYTESIPATGHNYVSGVCSVCGAADPSYSEDVTLTSISATYTGGEVDVGTALTDLVGISVISTYSDGSTAPVSGYTLSGEIAEGENTITVSYGGMTTTFTVTGTAESDGSFADDTENLLYSWDFTNGNLVDSVGGLAASVPDGMEHSAEGYQFTKANQYIQLAPELLSFANRTVEIEMTVDDTFDGALTQHARLFSICKTVSVYTHAAAAAFLYRFVNVGWHFYTAYTWCTTPIDKSEVPYNFFNGKTLGLYFDASMNLSVYADRVLVGTFDKPAAFSEGCPVIGGDSSNGTGDYLNELGNPTIKAVRIYDGAKG